jgi:hypothetical protein
MTPTMEGTAARLDSKAARFVAQWDTLVERMSVRFAVPAYSLLNAEGRRAAEVFAKTGREAAALGAVEDAPWEDYLSRVWLSTVPLAGELVTIHIPAPAKAAPTATAQAFVDAAVRYLRFNGADRVGGITQTSRDEIGNQIRIGFSKQESQDQIAARIVKHRRSIAPERAQMIARTEVHAASNFGSLEAARVSHAPLVKIWRARGGARPAHASASGQRQQLADVFIVGGYSMDHPGDWSGGAPAALIVNCRCTMTYEVQLQPVARERAA